MLEGHVAGSDDPEEAAALGWYFASWPTPFADEGAARAHLGDDAIVEAWIADLEPAPEGLHPRFDPDVLEGTIAAVHVPRWTEWEGSRCRRSRSLPGTGSSRQRTRTSWCVDGRAPCGSTSTGEPRCAPRCLRRVDRGAPTLARVRSGSTAALGRTPIVQQHRALAGRRGAP